MKIVFLLLMSSQINQSTENGPFQTLQMGFLLACFQKNSTTTADFVVSLRREFIQTPAQTEEPLAVGAEDGAAIATDASYN